MQGSGGAYDSSAAALPANDRFYTEATRMLPADRPGEPSSELAILHQQAVEKFSLSCLWKMKPSSSPHGMKVIADQLRKHGGMDAWRLAAKIDEALNQATR